MAKEQTTSEEDRILGILTILGFSQIEGLYFENSITSESLVGNAVTLSLYCGLYYNAIETHYLYFNANFELILLHYYLLDINLIAL